MRLSRTFIAYIIIMTVQIILCNVLNLSQYVTLTVLPVLLLCLPVRYGTPTALGIAFAIGFVTDFFGDGMLGLTVCALLPVAFLRRPIIMLVFGEEIFARQEDITLARQDIMKMTFGILLMLSIYLLVYIVVDSAGTRPFWFNAIKFVLSLLASYLASLGTAAILSNQSDIGRRR